MHGIIKHIFDKSIFIISPILSDQVFVGDVIGLHAKIKNTPNGVFAFVVDVIGLEPTTPSMSRRYSNHLSYTSDKASRL